MEGENKPSPSNPKYVIGRYEFWESYKGNKKLGNQETFAKLMFDTIADAKRVIDMAHLDKQGWYIGEVTSDDSYRFNVVQEHPAVIRAREDEDTEAEREKFKRHIKAAAINLSPKILTLYIGQTKAVFKRGEASYTPHMSSRVQTGVSITLYHKNPKSGVEIKREWFNPSEYISKDGKVQKVKFARDWGHFFEEDYLEAESNVKNLADLDKRMAWGELTNEEIEHYDVKYGTEHLREAVVSIPPVVKQSKILPNKAQQAAEVVLRAKFNNRKLKAKPAQSEVSGGR